MGQEQVQYEVGEWYIEDEDNKPQAFFYVVRITKRQMTLYYFLKAPRKPGRLAVAHRRVWKEEFQNMQANSLFPATTYTHTWPTTIVVLYGKSVNWLLERVQKKLLPKRPKADMTRSPQLVLI